MSVWLELVPLTTDPRTRPPDSCYEGCSSLVSVGVTDDNRQCFHQSMMLQIYTAQYTRCQNTYRYNGQQGADNDVGDIPAWRILHRGRSAPMELSPKHSKQLFSCKFFRNLLEIRGVTVVETRGNDFPLRACYSHTFLDPIERNFREIWMIKQGVNCIFLHLLLICEKPHMKCRETPVLELLVEDFPIYERTW